MSAFGGKADVIQGMAECPLIAISGHWWANENDGSGVPDRTPHLHDQERPRERDWKNRTTGSIVGSVLHREETHDRTESQTRGPRAHRGAVCRIHVGPDGPGWGWLGLGRGSLSARRLWGNAPFQQNRATGESG